MECVGEPGISGHRGRARWQRLLDTGELQRYRVLWRRGRCLEGASDHAKQRRGVRPSPPCRADQPASRTL